jgi:hypothetical protein
MSTWPWMIEIDEVCTVMLLFYYYLFIIVHESYMTSICSYGRPLATPRHIPSRESRDKDTDDAITTTCTLDYAQLYSVDI